ncbi:hypothetical protein BC941DRAFT_508851 [Chlamydoabsidia padenii]|nr:hypothetical protein BC941DRAFT_508851 [Chlamydoabsidia padenii]
MSGNDTLGEKAWISRRKEWTTATQTTTSDDSSRQPLQLNNDHKTSIYNALINERRSFKKPIPLGTVVDIVVYGWKKNGTWPDVPSAGSF